MKRENILIFLYNKLLLIKLFIFLFILFILSEGYICYPLRSFMDIGFVVHVHVFNVHKGSIASRDHLKEGHDISQSSLCHYIAIIYIYNIRVTNISCT